MRQRTREPFSTDECINLKTKFVWCSEVLCVLLFLSTCKFVPVKILKYINIYIRYIYEDNICVCTYMYMYTYMFICFFFTQCVKPSNSLNYTWTLDKFWAPDASVWKPWGYAGIKAAVVLKCNWWLITFWFWCKIL